MYDSIDEWFEAKVTASIRFVVISRCQFGCIEQSPIFNIWFTVFAHFNVHITMHYGKW